MSAISPIGMGAPPATSMPPIDPALEPADIRNGDAAAKKAYSTALGFEQILVNQLATQLTATMSSSSDSSDGLGGDSTDSSDSSTGGADPAGGAYAQMLPGALTTSIMSSGGIGIASEIAAGLDPALRGEK